MRTCIFKCMCSCVGKPVLAQTCSYVLLEGTHMTSIFSHLLQIVFISAATVQGPKIAASHPARLLDRPPCGKIKARLVGACRSPWLRIRTRKPGPDAATLAGLPRIILPKKGTSRPRSLRNRGLSQLPNSRPHRRRKDPTHQAIQNTMTTYLSETTKILDSISPETFQSEEDRHEIKEAARRLLARLETPFERGWALTLEVSVLSPGLIVFHDLGIWSKWNELNQKHGPIPRSLDQIVEMCSAPAEPNLLREYGSGFMFSELESEYELKSHSRTFPEAICRPSCA